MERETKGGRITDIEQDHEGGQLIYEVEFSLDGKEYELDIAADGKLLERRLDWATRSTPRANGRFFPVQRVDGPRSNV